MTIPTISIDGVSMPVTRDGTNLMSDMPLGAVASQVLEQGAAFEAAVEQFQRVMSELPVPANGTPAPLAPAVAQEYDPPAVPPAGGNLEAAGRRFPQVGTAPVPPPQVETAPVPPPQVETAPLPTPQVGTAPVPPPQVGTAPVPIPQVETAPVPPPQVETAPLPTPQVGTFPVPSPQVEASPIPVLAPAVAISCDPPVGASCVLPAEENGAPAADSSLLREAPREVPREPPPSPFTPSAVPQPAVKVQQPVATVPPEQQPSVQVVVDLQIDQVKPASTLPPPVAVVVDETNPARPEVVADESQEPPVLQAAPIAMPAQPQVIDVKNVAVEPVQVVAARVVHQVVATPAQVLIEAASAVADTIVVSPGLLRGTGEVQVQLRPDVLEGTVIRISTTAPGSLTVQFTPVNENMAALLEKCAPQLVTYLSERVHSVQIAVNVKRDEKLKG